MFVSFRIHLTLVHPRKRDIFPVQHGGDKYPCITMEPRMPSTQEKTRCIVSATELLEHIDDPDWIIVDCRFNLMKPVAGHLAWESGHIPRAVYADLDRDLAAPVTANGSGGRHPLPDPDELARTLMNWGVRTDSTVVAYDDVGNAVAARLWWLLRWLGHERVMVLDGGLNGWNAAGGELTTDTPTPARGSFAANPGSLSVIDAGQVQAKLERDELILLDARAEDRFSGRLEPIDRRAGHIPGARNTPFQVNLSADKCFRPVVELEAYYRAQVGDQSLEAVACMCGSGVTACHTLLALEAAGMSGASLYVGSWSDWISSEQRPIAGE